jgi:tRNA acetyltransferase TAN1
LDLLFITVASGFEKDAIHEMRAVLGDAVAWHRSAFKGVVIMCTSTDGRLAARTLGDHDLKYVARIVPVDGVVRSDPADIIGAVLDIGGIGDEDTFAVRCRRRGTHQFTSRDVEKVVGDAIDRGHVNLEAPGKVVNVEILFNEAYVSVLRAGEIIVKRIRVERKWEKGKRPINRSELKMAEILGGFPELTSCEVALDLGAAPGGWTKMLSRYMGRVYAVDPAALDDKVAGLENVTYVPKKLEELDDRDVPQRVNLIVCDANVAARELIPRLGPLVGRFLSERGFVVITLKAVSPLFRTELADSADALSKALGEMGVRIVAVIKLPHNTSRERTCVGRR